MFPFHLKRRFIVSALITFYWLACLVIAPIDSTPLWINFILTNKIIQIIIASILIFWVSPPLFQQIFSSLKSGFFTQELLLGISAILSFSLLIYAEFYYPLIILPLGLFLSICCLFSILWLLTKQWIEKRISETEIKNSKFYLLKNNQSHLLAVALITFCGVMFFLSYIFDYPLYLAQNSLLILISSALVVALTVPVLISLSLVLSKSEKKLIIWKNADQISDLSATQSAIFHLGNVFTHPEAQVQDILAARPKEVAYLAACLEKNIDHPIGNAITKYAEKIGLKDFFASDIEYFPAKGVVGKIGGRKVAIGNMVLMKQEGIVVGVLQREKYRLEDKGMEVLILGISSQEKNRLDKKPGEVLGMIVLKNEIRLSSKKIVQEFKKMSIDLWVITGHSARTSKAIAKEINIPEQQILCEKSPEEIEQTINLTAQKNSSAKNAILVDVILDKETQKQLIDISTLGNTRHSVMILDDNLALVAETINLARTGIKIIDRSLFYSILYYGLIILLAIIGFISKEIYVLYLPSITLILGIMFLAFLVYYPFWVLKVPIKTK